MRVLSRGGGSSSEVKEYYYHIQGFTDSSLLEACSSLHVKVKGDELNLECNNWLVSELINASDYVLKLSDTVTYGTFPKGEEHYLKIYKGNIYERIIDYVIATGNLEEDQKEATLNSLKSMIKEITKEEFDSYFDN